MISPQALRTHLPNAGLACSFVGQAKKPDLLPIIFSFELENFSMYVFISYF